MFKLPIQLVIKMRSITPLYGLYSHTSKTNIIITDGVQGMLPFMAVQLLVANEVEHLEHSEKHDLKPFFYVLLYICMMCSGPGELWNNDNFSDSNHPFGNWIHDVKTCHAIGTYRLMAFYALKPCRRTLLICIPISSPSLCSQIFMR